MACCRPVRWARISMPGCCVMCRRRFVEDPLRLLRIARFAAKWAIMVFASRTPHTV